MISERGGGGKKKNIAKWVGKIGKSTPLKTFYLSSKILLFLTIGTMNIIWIDSKFTSNTIWRIIHSKANWKESDPQAPLVYKTG